MSRDLPPNPNLEHLKKQAKELLRDRRQHDTRATLASAQHALARDYGFRSWRALKAQVESAGGDGAAGGRVTGTPAGGPPPNYSFERYTARAREALFFSRYEAAQVGSTEITPAHLLLGLVRAAQSCASRIVVRLPLEAARTAVMADTPPQPPLTNSHVIPFDEATKRLLLNAVEEADRHGHRGIGIVHMLLGVIHDEGSLTSTVLTTAGFRAAAIRADIERLVNEEGAV